MKQIVSVDLMRKSDFATTYGGISGKELMQRAAMGVYESVTWQGKIAIVCGSGNNAGDGYALALILNENRIGCDLVLINENKLSPDGKYYFDKCLNASQIAQRGQRGCCSSREMSGAISYFPMQ